MGKILDFYCLLFWEFLVYTNPAKFLKLPQKTQLDTLVIRQSLIEVYAPYKKKMNEEIHKVLFMLKHLTRTDGKMQSSQEFNADLMFEKANSLYIHETGREIDFVFSNYGGMRSGIWEGDVRLLMFLT